MNILPIGNRVLIQPFVSAEQTESGLILDNNNNTSAAPVLGTIIKVGDDTRFQEGEMVYFRRYSLDTLKIITEKGEVEVNLIDTSDILAKQVE